ncbi:DUF6000 family protein [Actinoallomurus sp. NPDC052274]|uniref:DUF6000 family protein n=1 Tax=Actinoallomurus sp. NPDC052274 TaxID=3155420 RepID=UPI00343FBBF3
MSTSPDHDPETVQALQRHVFGTGESPVPDLAPENAKAIRRYVVRKPWKPRYLKLLGGLSGLDHRFEKALVRDARKISDEDLDRLLSCGWRPRLVAAWLIGIDRRVRYRQRLGDLLLDSEAPYAGQGYCFALARFAQDEDAEILVSYLDRYLPRRECYYDQDWAIGALLYLDDRLGTRHADRFLDTGLWRSSAFADVDPADCRNLITGLCATVGELADPRPQGRGGRGAGA